jgi:hypothetical protein
MKRHLTAVTAIFLLPLAAAACSSSSSTPAAPMTGTETLNASLTGTDAATALNSNSSAPLSFPEATFAGLISTTIKPFTLTGSGNKAGDVSWTTPDGTVTVYHAPAKGFTNPNAVPPVTWVKSGTDCTGSGPFSKGVFTYVPSRSTGTFARLSGSGTYAVTTVFTAPLKSGDASKACSFATIGMVIDTGAKIDFAGSATATLKPASSSS